jgi:hypothetical protein
MNGDHQQSQTGVAPLDVQETAVPLWRKERAGLGHVRQWFSGTLSRKNLMALTGLQSYWLGLQHRDKRRVRVYPAICAFCKVIESLKGKPKNVGREDPDRPFGREMGSISIDGETG